MATVILMDCRHCGDMAAMAPDETDNAYCSAACRRADDRREQQHGGEG